MGIALMEGYASVDTGTLSDMRDVLGGHTDSEVCWILGGLAVPPAVPQRP